MLLICHDVPSQLHMFGQYPAYGFQLVYRNAGSPLTNRDIASAYVAATTVSCGIAYSMGRFAERSTRLGPATAAAIQKTVPYVACAAANLFNLAAMRSGDLGPGVLIRDADGTELGRSPIAARYALAQAGVTRVVLPAPVLLLPPIIMRVLDVRGAFAGAARLRPFVELSIIVSCVWGALPCAIALFPQVRRNSRHLAEPAGNFSSLLFPSLPLPPSPCLGLSLSLPPPLLFFSQAASLSLSLSHTHSLSLSLSLSLSHTHTHSRAALPAP